MILPSRSLSYTKIIQNDGIMKWRCGYCHVFDCRRKFLHTYRACAIAIQSKKLSIIMQVMKSRDAKSCVSQGGKSLIVNALLCAFIAMDSTGDARFCIHTGLAPCYQKRSAESVSSPLFDVKWWKRIFHRITYKYSFPWCRLCIFMLSELAENRPETRRSTFRVKYADFRHFV